MSARRFSRRLAVGEVVVGCAALALGACASSGRYVWYTDLPRAEWGNAPPEYVIGAGDSIAVNVYGQDTLTGAITVRSDGRVAIPLVGELIAAGKHPSALSREIEERLKRFIVNPQVTVNVTQSQPVSITTVGEVRSPGAVTLASPPRLLEALARAGGLSDFASSDKIFVLRPYPAFRRIRFTYRAIVNNDSGAANFLLQSGDVILVE